MNVDYQHRYYDGTPLPLPVGKIVCVGRNYVEHIRELNHAMPTQPILFMKPSTAFVSLEQPIVLPPGSCHHEVEIAVLLGQRLKNADRTMVLSAITGYAVALDLTLRDVQQQLKSHGYPWERAKSFDGACPISPFLHPQELPDLQNIYFSLHSNGQLRQQGNSNQMITGILDLIAYSSTYFTLLPGDVFLTGTPAGTGELHPGDQLQFTLAHKVFTTQIAQ